jgi:hypothetical protein
MNPGKLVHFSIHMNDVIMKTETSHSSETLEETLLHSVRRNKTT